MAIPDFCIRGTRGLVGECGNDMKTLSIDKGIRWICCRPVKCARTETTELHFMSPSVFVEGLEVFIKN
jgi:hypothetical protein